MMDPIECDNTPLGSAATENSELEEDTLQDADGAPEAQCEEEPPEKSFESDEHPPLYDSVDGMRKSSPEYEIMMLLWGKPARKAYDALAQNTNFSKLPSHFWKDATNGTASSYTNWVSKGINIRMHQLEKSSSSKEFGRIKSKFSQLRDEVIAGRSQTSYNQGHKAALDLWQHTK